MNLLLMSLPDCSFQYLPILLCGTNQGERLPGQVMFVFRRPPQPDFLTSRYMQTDSEWMPRKLAAEFSQGELTIVTSKDARDVSVEDAHDYILGYTVGNDLTARMFQDPKRGGGQFTRCKAFDGFAPLGPILTSARAFGPVQNAKITLKVNGKVFQNSRCALIHEPAKLISFLSQGKLSQHQAFCFDSTDGSDIGNRHDCPCRNSHHDRLAARHRLVPESEVQSAGRRCC